MKKIYSLILALAVTAIVAGQSPLSFKYQAVLRNLRGDIKANTSSTVGIAILQGSTNGTTVYSENHNVTTDNYGLINLEIGKGTPLFGSMSLIEWGNGTYFIRVTVDGIVMGTSQLLSVPYALYAEKAGNGFSGSYNDLKNKPLLFNGTWASLTGKPDFATVATTGNYNDLTNRVSAGNGLNINGENIISMGFAGQSAGDIIYFDGVNWVRLPKGSNGQILTLKDGVPAWQNGSAFSNPAAPAITAPVVSNITPNGVTLSSTVNPNGFMTDVEFVYGKTTDYEDGEFDTDPSVITGSDNVNVVAAPAYLEENTTYHFRLVASSAVGITYSEDMTFTTASAFTNKYLFRDTTATGSYTNYGALNTGYAVNVITNTFSFDFWVKPTRAITMAGESNICMGGVSVPLANSNQNWAIVPINGGLGVSVGTGLTVGTNGIMVAEHTGNLLVSRLSYTIPITDWVHVAVVYRPDSIFLYFNGDLVRRRTNPCSSILNVPNSLTGSMYSPDFKGDLDEFRLWDIPLTRQEVKIIKDKKLMSQVSGLRYYAGFDNGAFERTSGDLGTVNMTVTGLIPSKHIKTSSWDLVRYTGSTIGSLVPYPLLRTNM